MLIIDDVIRAYYRHGYLCLLVIGIMRIMAISFPVMCGTKRLVLWFGKCCDVGAIRLLLRPRQLQKRPGLINAEAWNFMSTSPFRGPEKTLHERMRLVVHAYAWKPSCSLVVHRNFSGF